MPFFILMQMNGFSCVSDYSKKNSSFLEESLESKNKENLQTALQTLFDEKGIYINIENIELINSFNFKIFEINHSWMIRFSQSKNKNLEKEKNVLETIKLRNPDLSIPIYSEVYSYKDEIRFVLYSKLYGEILKDEIYKTLNEQEQDQLAVDIAEFMYKIHHTNELKNSVSHESEEILGGLIPRVPEASLLNEKMEKYLALNAYADLLPLWKKVYRIYLRDYGNPYFFAPLHNDLHSKNLLIDPVSKRLTGVLDFEDVVYGHVSREFRHLFAIDPEFMIKVASAYAKKNNWDENHFIQSVFAFRLFRDFTNFWKAIEFPEIANQIDKQSENLLKTFLKSNNYQLLI